MTVPTTSVIEVIVPATSVTEVTDVVGTFKRVTVPATSVTEVIKL